MITKRPFRIRTITVFITLTPDDFNGVVESTAGLMEETSDIYSKIHECSNILRKLEKNLIDSGYEVQTVRISTNPFGEWLTRDSERFNTEKNHSQICATMDILRKLHLLNSLLDDYGINFFSCGPSTNPIHTIEICPQIIATSAKFSCSAAVDFGDSDAARAAAACIQKISTLGNNASLHGGLGNFRFCAASCIDTVPFFPGAKSPMNAKNSIAIGLENGGYARQLLLGAKNISNIQGIFHRDMRNELLPIQEICLSFARDSEYPVEYLGIDTR